jgi:HAD superfamily hydrolase (TIGR01509 family)
MPTFISTMLRILDENNMKYKADIVKTITPLGYEGTAEYYKTLGVPLTVQEMVKKMNIYAQKEYAENIQAKNNVINVLKILKARGDKLNILTASPHKMLDCCLMRLGILDLFDNVWSCDDFQTTKADLKIYKRVAERIGIGINKIIFLDDNLHALKTAKSAGMQVYGVYDASSKEYTKEIIQISNRYILDFTELL